MTGPGIETTASSARREALIGALLLVILVAACFGGAVRFDFVYDDRWTIVDNPVLRHAAITRASTWAGMFNGDLARRAVPDAGRPLMLVSEMLDTVLWRGSAFGFHFQNLVLHAATAILLFLGLLRLSGRRLGPSMLAAALFAVHPINAEPVAAINYREDLLVGLFLLLGLGALFKARRAARGRAAFTLRAAAFGAFVLAALAKESAYVAPLLLVLLDVWNAPVIAAAGSPSFRAQVGKNGRDWALAALAPLSVFVWRAAVMGGAAIVSRTAETTHTDAGGRLMASAWAFAASACKLVVPIGLSPEYEDRLFTGFGGILLASVLVSALVALVIAVAVLRTRAPAITLGAAFALVAYLPTAGVIPITNVQADRYFYLPSMGLLAALSWGLAGAIDRIASTRFSRFLPASAVWVLGAVLVAGSGLRAHAQTRIWSSEATVWDAAIVHAPGSPRSWVGRASTLLTGNLIFESMAAAKVAVDMSDGYAAHQILGLGLLRRGDIPAACIELELARDRGGSATRVEAINNLGYCYRRAGRYPEALTLLREARRLAPWFDRPWLTEATTLAAMGRFAEARALLREFLAMQPGSREARYLLDRIDATGTLPR